MAFLYILEASSIGQVANGTIQSVNLPAIATQRIAIGGTSTQSAPFNTTTKAVRLHSDAICSIAGGASPVATTSSPRMAADQTEYFAVNGGDRIAVISNT